MHPLQVPGRGDPYRYYPANPNASSDRRGAAQRAALNGASSVRYPEPREVPLASRVSRQRAMIPTCLIKLSGVAPLPRVNFAASLTGIDRQYGIVQTKTDDNQRRRWEVQNLSDLATFNEGDTVQIELFNSESRLYRMSKIADAQVGIIYRPANAVRSDSRPNPRDIVYRPAN